MLTPDLELGRRFVRSRALPGRPLVVAVTGAHLYGFPSPDSDLDLKGFHLARTRDLLGLRKPDETVDCIEIFEGEECDLTSHEIAKALALLYGGNGNVLEQILSPLQLFESEELEDLRRLAKGALSKRFASHYRGFFRGTQREHAREPKAKTMLYAYRVALTGIHLFATAELEACVLPLAPRYGFPDVLELVDRKARGDEKGALESVEDEHHRQSWPKLEAMLDETLATSALPDEPANREEAEDFLVGLRLRELGGEMAGRG